MISTDQQAIVTPSGFCEHILKLNQYDWCKNILGEFLKPPPIRIAVSACNEAGKTTRIGAPLALWFAAFHPKSLVLVTAAVERHLRHGFFHALSQYAHLFDKKHQPTTEYWELPNGSRIIGFCTNQAGKFEQWHNDNFLAIVDEAKTVEASILQTLDARCRPTHTLYISSTGQKSGEFYKAFTNPKYGFKTFKITAHQCPHISQERIRYIEEKYANMPSFIRSTLYGEFMDDDGEYIIGISDIHDLWANPPIFINGKRVCMIDLGLGVAETTMAIMQGNKMEKVLKYIHRDTDATIGWVLNKLEEEKIEEAWCDEGTAGLAMFQAIKKAAKIVVKGVMNQQEAYDSKHYLNRGAEMWFDAQWCIKQKRIIMPKDDDILIEQLTGRLKAFNERTGRMGVETKEDMKERGLESPDRGDAFCGIASMFRWGYHAIKKDDSFDPIQTEYDRLEMDYVKIGGGGDGGAY